MSRITDLPLGEFLYPSTVKKLRPLFSKKVFLCLIHARSLLLNLTVFVNLPSTFTLLRKFKDSFIKKLGLRIYCQFDRYLNSLFISTKVVRFETQTIQDTWEVILRQRPTRAGYTLSGFFSF